MKITVDGESVEVDEIMFPSNVMRRAGIKRPQDYDLMWIQPHTGKHFLMDGQMSLNLGDEFITGRKSATNG